MRVLTLPLRVLFCVIFGLFMWACIAIGAAIMIFEDLWGRK